MIAKDRIVLQKICNYIRDAISFTADIDFYSFMQDRKTMSASAFSIGQIGELVRELSNEAQTNNPQIPWKNIRGMRNRIVHDYENLDLAVLWRTLTTNLPELLIMLEGLLEKEALHDFSPDEED